MPEVPLAEARRLLEGLEAIEIRMADFYEACGLSFSEDRNFWSRLSRDERMHASMIRGLKDWIRNRDSVQISPKLKRPVLEAFVNGVDEQLDRVKQGLLTPDQAIFIALDMENTLFERRFPQMVMIDDPEFVEVVSTIAEETEGHRRALEAHVNRRSGMP